MDILIRSPLPLVDPGDLIERLNARKVSALAFEYARQYATPGGKAQAWGKAEWEQVKRDLATYPLFQYLSIALGARVRPAPFRGRIDAAEAEPYRPALDWLALAGLVQAGIRLGICPACGKFFADTKRRGKAVCSPTCGGRLRARRHYAALKAKPHKYRAYKKKQRERMKDRRADGLA